MDSSSTKTQQFTLGLWAVRYQVKDVQGSIAFYTQTLGFNCVCKICPLSVKFQSAISS